jgi:hypothetical protein
VRKVPRLNASAAGKATNPRESWRKKQAQQVVTAGPEFRRAELWLGALWRRREAEPMKSGTKHRRAQPTAFEISWLLKSCALIR